MIKGNEFPKDLKYAEVTPIFKKNDNLDKENYRPVSVLPCISKIYEKILCDQLMSYMEPRLSPRLSGFRKGYSCQSLLTRFVEDSTNALDNGQIMGAILTGLSKAFDCLPHRLLITKMNAYGISKPSCSLVASYLTSREQRVKLGHNRSDRLSLRKGAPQGSVFGPHLYNIFTNDLLVSTSPETDKYNYADDNTVAAQGKEFNTVKVTLEKALSKITTWFIDNYMKANPSKYQAIVFERRNEISEARRFWVSGT